MSVTTGSSIGPYDLLREVGRGGTATVFEARHRELGKRVAVKVMHAHLAADAAASRRFLREGRAAATVRSPHVVDVFDVGEHEGVPYLVMELLPGESLAAVLRERGRLPLGELADLMLPIAAAVHAAHEVGVVHRDLKPSNVVLAERAAGAVAPVILDFGISRLEGDPERDLTRSEALIGTVHYLSPEQTRGGRNASTRSDQYALGVMLYECATGARPFRGATHYALLHAIVSSKPAPPSTLDPALPAAFDAVVARAMHRDPNKRFASVRDLGAALVPWASPESQERWRGQLGAPAEEGSRRRPWRRVAAAFVAVGALAAAAAAVAASSLGPRDRGAASRAVVAAPRAPSAAADDPGPERADVAPRAESPVPATSAAAEPPLPPPPPRSAAPRTAGPPPRTSAAPRQDPPAASTLRGTNGALIVE
jgi:serine/threonine-protein kinase